MKSATAAAGPYEFFRWKSSRGRLVVRTTWVKGVRHVILSDDDDENENEKRQSPAAREKNASHRTTTVPANRQALSVVCADDNCVQLRPAACDNDGDGYYAERVLQWLRKPSATLLDTQSRKSASASGNGTGGSARSRRPALVKTCSIPDNDGKFDEDQQVAGIVKRSAKSASRNNNNNNCTQNRHKIELHVHIPPTCSPVGDDNY